MGVLDQTFEPKHSSTYSSKAQLIELCLNSKILKLLLAKKIETQHNSLTEPQNLSMMGDHEVLTMTTEEK